MEAFLKDLRKRLSKWPISMDPQTLPKRLEGLETTVIRPAAELKQAIACSSFEYRIEEPKGLLRQVVPEETQLLHWTLKDVVKWRDRDVSEGIGGVLCCLFPAVYRKGISNEDRLVVVKPVVLVHDWEASRLHQEPNSTGDQTRRSQRSLTKSEQGPPQRPPPVSRTRMAKSLENSQPNSPRGKPDEAGSLWTTAFTSVISIFTPYMPDRRQRQSPDERSRRKSEDKNFEKESSNDKPKSRKL
jgi:hypothetical protein